MAAAAAAWQPHYVPAHGDDVAVLAVDDHPAFRAAVRVVIDATPGFELVGEAASGEEALTLLASCDPDLVLVDIHLPGIDGLELTRRLRATPAAPIVVLMSADDDPALVRTPGACGAATFVPKTRFARAELAKVWARFGGRAHTPR
jgi:DNA-binding NarL/FixJ family response regulator